MSGTEPMKPVGEVMIEAGYSEKTSKIPQKLTGSKAWERFLATIDETPIVTKWMEWALDSKDKRTALQAGEDVMKLKGRFKEVLDVGLYKKREELFTDDVQQR